MAQPVVKTNLAGAFTVHVTKIQFYESSGWNMKLCFMIVAIFALGASAASANPVEHRKQLMKDLQAVTKEAAAIARGAVVFDHEKVRLIIDSYVKASKEIPALFPAGSDIESGTKTAAAPKIWSDNAGFRAIAAKLHDDAIEAQGATDPMSFNRAFRQIIKNCSACHAEYRLNQQ